MSREERSNTLYSLSILGSLSEALEVALELDVLAKLRGRHCSVTEASVLWELPETSTRVLAQFLCHMGVLSYNEGKLSVSSMGELLVSDSFARNVVMGSLRASSRDATGLKERLIDPKPLVWYDVQESREPSELESIDAFYDVHHQLRIRWGEDLASQYDFSSHRVLMDVGGASGSWCIGVRSKAPDLRCVLFDLEEATTVAEGKIKEAGQEQFISVKTGNFFEEALPKEADVVLLANVLHDWTIDDGCKILRNVHGALPDEGVVLVKEFYLEDDWTGASSIASLEQALGVLGSPGKSGWQPSYAEMESLLRDEGFCATERRYNLVIGTKM